MNMKNRAGGTGICNLFNEYRTMLRRFGVSRVLASNKEVTAEHVLRAICLANLRSRLELDLFFSHARISENLKELVK